MTQLNEVIFKQELQATLTENPDFLRELLTNVLQKFLEAEISNYLGAEPSQRIGSRQGYRCGYYDRSLITRVGRIQLRVPRDRDGGFSTVLFERYQRSEKALLLAIMEAYIQGVSTRRIKKITEDLCGVSFSKSQVSELMKGLDEELSSWRTRRLKSYYPVIYVDGMYVRVREEHRVIKQVALVVLGVKPDGQREILATEVVHEENEIEYHTLFQQLKTRGLRKVDLVVSDAHSGLKAAISRGFPSSAWQRCLVHFLRNFHGKCPARHRKEIRAKVMAALKSADKFDAEKVLLKVAERVSKFSTSLANWLEEAVPEILAHMEFAPGLWSRIRSNNLLERFNEELRRRVRVVRIFPNHASALRLITALSVEQDEEWQSGRRYLNPELLKTLPQRKAS
jgi:putative transposase